MSTFRKLQLPKTIGEVLLCIFNCIFFVIFLYFFLHSLINNGAPYLSFSAGKVLLTTGIILFLLLFIYFVADLITRIVKRKHNTSEQIEYNATNKKTPSKRIAQAAIKKQQLQKRRNVIYWIVGFIILFIAQIMYTRMFYTSIGWDCGTIVSMAIGMLQGNTDSLGYLAQFPNNSALFLLLYHYFKICLGLGITDLVFASVVLNIVFLDIAVVFMICVAHKVWNKISEIAVTLVLSILALAFTPWLIVPYTDTITILFPIAFLFLFQCISDQNNNISKKKQTVLLLVLGFLIFMGFKLKPSSIILIIAIGIVVLCIKKDTKQQFATYGKNMIIMLCGVLVALTLFTVDSNAVLGEYLSKDVYDTYEMPASYFTMVGLQKQPVSENKALWGAFNSEDYFAVSNITGKSAKKDYISSVIKNRIEAFGFTGSIEFLMAKANFCFEDGTFFWGSEGNFITGAAPATSSSLGKWIQSFIYFSSPNYASGYSYLLQGIWMTILLLILMGIVLAPNSYKNLPFMIMRITIFGLLLYLLFFEARSRYLINYLPIFILLAVNGLLSIINSFHSLKIKTEAE